MKKLLALLVIPILSCITEPITPPLEKGYLKASLSIPNLSTFKASVPECSLFTPNEIYYRLIRPDNGTIHEQTAPIELNGNQILSTEPMEFLVGNYEVDEVSLRYNGIITHTAPYENDPRYDFGRYVERTLPYNITISPNETTTSRDQVLCYTEEIIEINGDFEWVGEVIELKTMYFYIPPTSCIEYVTLEIDNYRIVEIPIFETGLQSLPIPAEFTRYALRAYDNDAPPQSLLQSFTGVEYNPDNNSDQDDILFFGDNCDD